MDTASKSGIQFSGPLSLELMPAEGLQLQQFELSAFIIPTEIEQTAILKIKPQKILSPEIKKKKQAYLLLQNQEVFHIDRGIIQIGRKRIIIS